MSDDVYRKLAAHLDRLPGGFAPSDTDADLRLLQRLFTPEEAELAIHLTLDREKASVIAARVGLPVATAEQRLDEMSDKGLILSIQSKDGFRLYSAAPFIVGIYEFQVNNLNEGMLHDLADYWSTQKPRHRASTIPQMRTIPLGQSSGPRLEALPYEQIDELIEAHSKFAISPCICRRHARLMGGGCDAPEESCLVLGEFAEHAIRGGRAHAIDLAEVKAILARADAANLVLQPSNSQHGAFICCCCGCCCGVLRGLQREQKPAEAVASAFIATFEPELCQGCWICLERCQMQALTQDGNRVALNADRCIGCGLCVSTCPGGALTLARKPASRRTQPPPTLEETWRIIARDQAAAR